MFMTLQNPLSRLFSVLLFSILILPINSSSLSTVSISRTTSQTVICALIPTANQQSISFINCTGFPASAQRPIIIPAGNASYSALVGGNGYLCALRSAPLLNNSVIRCWRFSDNGAVPDFKRIYRGPDLDELVAGTSHFCGRERSTRRVHCWQWPEFSTPTNQSLNGIAVGGEFLCGLSDSDEINCWGNDSNVLGSVPKETFSVVAAGFRHACAISKEGRLECWGQTIGTPPAGEEFSALALGESRTCALRHNGTAICWGDEFELPENLRNTSFVAIEAQGSVFCGIVTENYSLFCWGNGISNSNVAVFEWVVPGSCNQSCSGDGAILPDSAQFCSSGGVIWQSCNPHKNPPPPLESPANPPESSQSKSKENVAFLVVGIVGTALGSVAVLGFLYFRFCTGNGGKVHDSGRLDEESPPAQPDGSSIRRVRSMPQPRLEKRLSTVFSMGHGGNLEEFPLEVILRITDNFSEDRKIGSGGFGTVYKATLDDGRQVAIKRAELSAAASCGIGPSKRQDKESAFLSELALLSRLNHKNLVRLLAFCDEENERVLVYEHISNGTLHDHLHKIDGSPLASWTARLRVALDAARGIEYLHTYAVPPIIHRDIKSSNILLDATWTAKVSDFGLSLMGPDENTPHLSLRAAGTVGYMDPEYYRLELLTTKSDVYSFGVVMLELLTGYKAIHRHEETGLPTNVVDFAVPYIIDDHIHRILDPKLPPPTPYEIEAVTHVGYIATDCVTLEGPDRPTMTEIVNSLERALALCAALPPVILTRSATR